MNKEEISYLAGAALSALISQTPVTVIHAKGWGRNGFPLPIKKMKPDANGVTTQQYRPMAIFEYINDFLSGEIASRLAAGRKRPKKNVPTSPDETKE